MNVDSKSDLPIFSLLHLASKHDSHGFLHNFFRLKSFLPDYEVTKLLLDSAHDAMPYYRYCKRANITPSIDLNGKGCRPPVIKMISRLIKMQGLLLNALTSVRN